MKRINQFERTNNDITNAVLRLMDDKSFENITIQDILEEAMINRSTFYQHYNDKYDVLEKLQAKIYDGFNVIIEKLMDHKDLDMIDEEIYRYLSKYRIELKKLFEVKSKYLDIQEKMENSYVQYIKRSNNKLNDLECHLLAKLVVEYMIYVVEEDISLEKLSNLMLNTWMNMTTYFFRVDDIKDADKKILEVIKKMHNERGD